MRNISVDLVSERIQVTPYVVLRLQKNYSKKGAKVPKQHVNEHNVICMSKFKYSIYLQSYAQEIEFKSSPKAESLKMTSRLAYFVNT